MVLEKTLESPLDCKGIKPVHLKGNQPWIFIERTDVEAETPIVWPPDAKNWFIAKDPGKNWRQEETGTKEEMVGWHHRLDGHEFKQAPRAGDEQGSLACCNPWGCKESDMTERLNWTECFLDKTLKIQAEKVKINKRNYIKLIHFCTAKEIINKNEKVTYILGENICIAHIW